MKKHIAVVSLLLLIIPSFAFAVLNRDLAYGAKGQDVFELQNFLINKGFLEGPATGNYFALTRKAVIAYQASTKLIPSGIVGPLFRTRFNASAKILTTAPATVVEKNVVGNQLFIAQLEARIKELIAQLALLRAQSSITLSEKSKISASSTATIVTTTPVSNSGGGGGGGGGTPPLPAITAVSLSPISISVGTSSQTQFTAIVTGTGNFSNAVTWSAASGTISTLGLYTAPAATGTDTVTVTSVQDASKIATSSVAVIVPIIPTITAVIVSPATTSVNMSAQIQFAATTTGTGSFNNAVTWSAINGTITPLGLYTAPAAVGTDTVTAISVQDGTKVASSSVTITHAWDVTVTPPVMVNPTTIVLDGTNYLNSATTTFADLSVCAGPAYVIDLSADNTKDYIIKSTAVLHAPLNVYGGHNVRVVGIQMDLSTAACGSMGLSGYVPGAIALKMYQTGTSYVEGAYIDLADRSSDCIDPRNFIAGFDALNKGYTEVNARGERDVIVQNTVCRGMAGDSNVHGDIIQTQGLAELFRNITLENVSTDSNCEGTEIEPRLGYFAANAINLRRFDYRKDLRYPRNPIAGGGFYDGGAIMLSAKSYSFDQVYTFHNLYPTNYQQAYLWTPTSTSTFSTTRGTCNANGIFCSAIPANNRYASPGTGEASSLWTGLNYTSPFGF